MLKWPLGYQIMLMIDAMYGYIYLYVYIFLTGQNIISKIM